MMALMSRFILLYIIFGSLFIKPSLSTDVTLDINQENSDDEVLVNHGDHYGLSSTEFYLQHGFKASSVVQGNLPIWFSKGVERVMEATLYFGHDPLSLLYLNVHEQNTSVYKYYVKIGNTWKEVVDSAFWLFFDIDRSSYTYEELDSFADEMLQMVDTDLLSGHLLYPNAYSYILEPSAFCKISLGEKDDSMIMKQYHIGPIFANIYSPRLGVGVYSVNYHGNTLWRFEDPNTMCSSVWVLFKGDFDKVVLVNTYNFLTKKNSCIPYIMSNDMIVQTPIVEAERYIIKMHNSEYNQKDLNRYMHGYLEADFAYVLKPICAILIATFTVYCSIN